MEGLGATLEKHGEEQTVKAHNHTSGEKRQHEWDRASHRGGWDWRDRSAEYGVLASRLAGMLAMKNHITGPTKGTAAMVARMTLNRGGSETLPRRTKRSALGLRRPQRRRLRQRGTKSWDLEANGRPFRAEIAFRRDFRERSSGRGCASIHR